MKRLTLALVAMIAFALSGAVDASAQAPTGERKWSLPSPHRGALTAGERAIWDGEIKAFKEGLELRGVTDDLPNDVEANLRKPIYAVQSQTYGIFLSDDPSELKMTLLKRPEAEALFMALKGSSIFSTWVPGQYGYQKDMTTMVYSLLKAKGILPAIYELEGTAWRVDGKGVEEHGYFNYAPVVLVQDGSVIRPYVFDISLDKPVSLKDWHDSWMRDPRSKLSNGRLQNSLYIDFKGERDRYFRDTLEGLNLRGKRNCEALARRKSVDLVAACPVNRLR